MRFVLLGALLVIARMLSVEARAQSAETSADIRCVIVGAQLANSPNPNERTRAAMLMIYYIGRLDGRSADHDLERLVVNELASMTAAELQSEAHRCGEALELKGEEITRIGESLTKHGH